MCRPILSSVVRWMHTYKKDKIIALTPHPSHPFSFSWATWFRKKKKKKKKKKERERRRAEKKKEKRKRFQSSLKFLHTLVWSYSHWQILHCGRSVSVSQTSINYVVKQNLINIFLIPTTHDQLNHKCWCQMLIKNHHIQTSNQDMDVHRILN